MCVSVCVRERVRECTSSVAEGYMEKTSIDNIQMNNVIQ